tara:strand:- start:835 stop:1278 length:444 start_codon:yes stop_codon:yes gene_type:complete
MSSLEQKVKVMENLNYVGSYGMSKSGWMIGLRVWTLKAYDSRGSFICEVSEKRDNNYLKYVDFINKLIRCGYKLTERQRKEMKDSDFMSRAYLSRATRDHFVEIGRLAGFSETDYYNVKNKPENIQRLFAERLGLEYSELIESFSRF